MEIISRVSRGSRMDQVYLPKNRAGLQIGQYVVVKPLEREHTLPQKPYFYNASPEPIKVRIIEEIFHLIDQLIDRYDNIIVTGSFLDKGFNFNDIDILIVTGSKIQETFLKNRIESLTGVIAHLIILDKRTLLEGLSSDPLYQTMLSSCVSKRRMIYAIEPKIDYKLLDLQLLKSKLLLDNFDLLNGNEKYYLTRNMIAIALHLRGAKLTKELIDNEIKRLFHLENVKRIKENMIEKNAFLKDYKCIYGDIFNRIMEHAKHGAK